MKDVVRDNNFIENRNGKGDNGLGQYAIVLIPEVWLLFAEFARTPGATAQ